MSSYRSSSSNDNKRRHLIIEIPSDDEEDDALLNDTSSLLRKKGPSTASLVTPKQEQYLTPLGTSTFTTHAGDSIAIGEQIRMTCETKGAVRDT